MWDKTKAYKNSRTVKRGYDLMFENFFFLLSFFLCQNYFQFQPGVIFPFFFMCQTQSPCTWKFRWSQGGQVPPLAPLWLRHCLNLTRFVWKNQKYHLTFFFFFFFLWENTRKNQQLRMSYNKENKTTAGRTNNNNYAQPSFNNYAQSFI